MRTVNFQKNDGLVITDHLTTHNQDVHTLIDKIHANSNNDMLGETISEFFLD